MTDQNRNRNGYNLADVALTKEFQPQDLLVEFQIYTESIWRTCYQGNKPLQRDEVDPLELARALAGLDSGTGLLPQNILFYRQAGQQIHLGLYLPPAVQILHVDGQKQTAYQIPVPPLVFTGQNKTYRLYALARPGWPEPETPLYRAPFPNVYNQLTRYERSGICHGSAEFPVAAPETIRPAAQLFFESRFNHDLAQGKSKKYPQSVLLLWQEIVDSKLDAYPVNDLVPADLKMEDLLK